MYQKLINSYMMILHLGMYSEEVTRQIHIVVYARWGAYYSVVYKYQKLETQ